MRLSPLRPATLALLALAGCARTEPRPEPPADPGGLVPRRVEIGGDRVVLLVPPAARVVARSGDRAVVEFAPDSRGAPTLTLTARAAPPEAFSREAALASRATLRYNVWTEDVSGSGGPLSTLRGRLDLPGGPALGVECTEQRELPRPTWCVAYLHHLRSAE